MHLDEYEALMATAGTDQLRAWIREADRVCRANLELLKEK